MKKLKTVEEYARLINLKISIFLWIIGIFLFINIAGPLLRAFRIAMGGM